MIEPAADSRSPDRSICRHCGQDIVWDDWSYVHLNGWADCNASIRPTGERLPPPLDQVQEEFRIKVVEVEIDSSLPATSAEPIEWGTP